MIARYAVLAVAMTVVAAVAHAGPPPSAEERTQIESALKAEGFTSWGKIELDDDGYWEVDDAIGPDGKRFDVDLGKSDFKILKKEIDKD
jgi:hypothetical protein